MLIFRPELIIPARLIRSLLLRGGILALPVAGIAVARTTGLRKALLLLGLAFRRPAGGTITLALARSCRTLPGRHVVRPLGRTLLSWSW